MRREKERYIPARRRLTMASDHLILPDLGMDVRAIQNARVVSLRLLNSRKERQGGAVGKGKVHTGLVPLSMSSVPMDSEHPILLAHYPGYSR